MEEIWKAVPGYEGYEVSNTEKIKSWKGGEHYLSTTVGSSGRVNVSIWNKGKVVTRQLGCFVALAFPEICGEWFPGAWIDHIDTNPLNNKPENLRWVDGARGQYTNVLTREHNQKARQKNIKLMRSVIQIKNNEEVCCFKSVKDASIENSIDPGDITRCCNGKRKTAGGYKWKYNAYEVE